MKKMFFTGDRSSLYSKLGITYGHILTDGMDPELVLTMAHGEKVAACMVELELATEAEAENICKNMLNEGVCKDAQAIADSVMRWQGLTPNGFVSRWEFKFEKCTDCPEIHGVIVSKTFKMTEVDTFLDAIDACDNFFRGHEEVEMDLAEAVYILRQVLAAKMTLEYKEDQEIDQGASDETHLS